LWNKVEACLISEQQINKVDMMFLPNIQNTPHDTADSFDQIALPVCGNPRNQIENGMTRIVKLVCSLVQKHKRSFNRSLKVSSPHY
jgi:hypothetical protein